MECYDPGSHQLAVSGDGPHGVRHAYRDVGDYLRTDLGRLGKDICVGALDCGCCCRSIGDFIALVHTVGLNPLLSCSGC